MSTTALVLSVLLPPATSSIGSGGGINFPLYSSDQKKDPFMGESNASLDRVLNLVPAPNVINDTPSDSVHEDSFGFSSAFPHTNASTAGDATFDNFMGGDFSPGTSSRGKNYAPAFSDSRNHTSRFFSINTDEQTLDIELSFTVPFISFPLSSLVNISQNMGENTLGIFNSLVTISWPSVFIIGSIILGALLIFPQLGSMITSLMSGTRETSSYSSINAKTDDGGDTGLPVTPFTSILEQLDDALAQYDLDSTSCMQRAVCSYVADSEERVKDGEPHSSEMIVVGLARSHWMKDFLGQGSIAQAVEMGTSGGHCQKQFPKCPFSLGGVLRFLTAYAKIT